MTADMEQIAEELAEVLMRSVSEQGPLGRIRELTRLLKVLRATVRIVTERRDREAYALGALYSHAELAKHAGVTRSTMQRWCESGTASAARGRLWPSQQEERSEG